MNRKLLALGTTILSPVIAGLPAILVPSAVAVLFLITLVAIALPPPPSIAAVLLFNGDEAAVVLLAVDVLASAFGLDQRTAALVAF
jgi:hypothetical protein